MAFWDNWFKVECQSCGEKFSKEELTEHEGKQMCDPCIEEAEEAARLHAIEVEKRRAAEEAARAALLDRPIETSGKAFGASYDDVKSGGNNPF